MGEGIMQTVINTRPLNELDAMSVVRLAYKALVESGKFDTDYDEQHFYTYIKKALVSPFYKGSIGIFNGDLLIGFAMLGLNSLPWAPKNRTATLLYFFVENTENKDIKENILFDSIENYCRDNHIQTLQVSDHTITVHSLMNFGFKTQETFFSKDYDIQD
jgi:hypothetical protein